MATIVISTFTRPIPARGKDRSGGGRNSGGLDDHGCVVNDCVDAHDLLEDREANADDQRGPQRWLEQIGEAAFFLGRASRPCSISKKFPVDIRCASNPRERRTSAFGVARFAAATGGFPAGRAFPAPKIQGREQCKCKHPTPALDLCKRVIHNVGEQDANGDRKLKQGDLPAPRVRRRNL